MRGQFFDVYDRGVVWAQLQRLVHRSLSHCYPLTPNIGRVDALGLYPGLRSVQHFLFIKLELHASIITGIEQGLAGVCKIYWSIRPFHIWTLGLQPLSVHPNDLCTIIGRLSNSPSPRRLHQRFKTWRRLVHAQTRTIYCRGLGSHLGVVSREPMCLGLLFAELLGHSQCIGQHWRQWRSSVYIWRKHIWNCPGLFRLTRQSFTFGSCSTLRTTRLCHNSIDHFHVFGYSDEGTSFLFFENIIEHCFSLIDFNHLFLPFYKPLFQPYFNLRHGGMRMQWRTKI